MTLCYKDFFYLYLYQNVKTDFSVVDGALGLSDTEKLFMLDHRLMPPVPLLAAINSVLGCSSKGLQVIYWYKAILTDGY